MLYYTTYFAAGSIRYRTLYGGAYRGRRSPSLSGQPDAARVECCPRLTPHHASPSGWTGYLYRGPMRSRGPEDVDRCMADFFVSYTSTDKAWAEWIGFILEEEGFTVVIQAWDFRPGSNFVLEMQRAAKKVQNSARLGLSTWGASAHGSCPQGHPLGA
jgi:TIR domain